MKILLDTCTFLWIIKGSSELSSQAKSLFSQPENEVYLSVISMWEMLIKYQLGRLPLPGIPDQFLIEKRKLHGIESIELNEDALSHLSRLPEYHRDPFDRILVCQAIAHNLTILTPDKDIRQYPVSCAW